jgi:hypothetical protein
MSPQRPAARIFIPNAPDARVILSMQSAFLFEARERTMSTQDFGCPLFSTGINFLLSA